MSKTDTSPRQQQRRRSVWRVIGFGVLGLVGVAALAAGGGAWWLWGWRAGELSYHESWTPEQRAALAAMDAKLRRVVDVELAFLDELEEAVRQRSEAQASAHSNDEDELHEDVGWRLYKHINPLAALPRSWRFVVSSAAMRDMLAEMRTALKEAAASGRGNVCALREVQMSLAHAAIRLGETRLVPGLIQHGESPNTALVVEGADTIRETLFQSAILCTPLSFGSAIPTRQERRELMEYLLEHGALVDGEQSSEAVAKSGHYSMLLAAMSPMYFGDDERGEALELLLEHGLTPAPKDAAFLAQVLRSEGTLPTMRRLHGKGLLGVHATEPRLRAALLHALLSRGHVPQIAEKVRWALEELGADPTLPVLQEDGDAPKEATPTIDLALSDIYRIDREEMSEEAQAEAAEVLAAIDLLLAHGARPEAPERYLPRNAALREQYLALLARHGIHPAHQTPAERDPEIDKLRKHFNKLFNNL